MTAAMSNTSGAAKTGGALRSEFDRLQARPRLGRSPLALWERLTRIVGSNNGQAPPQLGLAGAEPGENRTPHRPLREVQKWAAVSDQSARVEAGPMSPAEHFGRPPCARSHSSSQCDFHALCGLPHGRMGERPLRLLCTNLGGKSIQRCVGASGRRRAVSKPASQRPRAGMNW